MVGFGSQSGSAAGVAFARYKWGAVTGYTAPNSSETFFNRRNKFGVTVGSYLDNNPAGQRSHGLVVSGNNQVTVDFPNAYSTNLTSINNYGAILGQHSTKSGIFDGFNSRTARFDASTTQTLFRRFPMTSTTLEPLLESTTTRAINPTASFDRTGFTKLSIIRNSCLPIQPYSLASGTIVGYLYNGPIPQSFIYSNGVFKDIVHPNIFYTLVWGINAFGYIVGSTDLNSGGQSMFTAHCQ